MGRGSQTHHSVSDSPCELSPSKFLLATTSFCCGSSASQVPAVDLAAPSPLRLATSSLCSIAFIQIDLDFANVLRCCEVRANAGTCRVCHCQLVQPEDTALPAPGLFSSSRCLPWRLCLRCFDTGALLYWFPPLIRWSPSLLFDFGADEQNLVCHQWSLGDVSWQIPGSSQDSCSHAVHLKCRGQQVVHPVQ